MYGVILADPPWSYRDKAKAGNRGAESHYPCMDLASIKAMPVQELAAEHCVLFLWVTFPLLKEGIDVLESWGFTYRTNAFTWVKTTKLGKLFWGMGNWTRANTEICLLGIKGNPKRVSADVHSVIMAPIGRHSAKPPEVHQRIEELLGIQRRLELFAREPRAGWHSHGLDLAKPHVILAADNRWVFLEL